MKSVLLMACLVALPASSVEAKLRVVASTQDLASIAASVGGAEVEVTAIARPRGDAHRVEVLPSYMVRVSKARVYLQIGLGLDAWASGIIDGSRNRNLEVVDCSRGVAVLEKPTEPVTAAMGDVHPSGNPHYWLDPRNGAVVARNVADALARVDPAHADGYRARADAFARECGEALADGRKAVAAMPVRVALTYHRSWSYLGDAFGVEIAGTVEPVPGIPPTARHLGDLVKLARARRIPVLIQEPYFSADAGQLLAREAGVRVVVASPSCETAAAGAYLDHLAEVLRAVAGPGTKEKP